MKRRLIVYMVMSLSVLLLLIDIKPVIDMTEKVGSMFNSTKVVQAADNNTIEINGIEVLETVEETGIVEVAETVNENESEASGANLELSNADLELADNTIPEFETSLTDEELNAIFEAQKDVAVSNRSSFDKLISFDEISSSVGDGICIVSTDMDHTNELIRLAEEKAAQAEAIIASLESNHSIVINYSGKDVVVTERDFEIMCKIVEAEAGTEDFVGKELVANVILNRVVSDEFPGTIESVVFDGAAFKVTTNGMYQRAEATEETIEAVKAVLNGADESEGAVYFVTDYAINTGRANWLWNETFLFKHMGHNFYK